MEQKTERKIQVLHIDVRMSISFLVLKLIVADSLFTIILVGLYSVLSKYDFFQQIAISSGTTIFAFVAITVIETVLTIYIVLEWLNEYYEISPIAVTHKRGVIFKKRDRFAIQNIKQIVIEQGIVGRMLNYGTLNLFDWRLQKCAELYAVHNPMRHLRILEDLLPNIDEHQSTIIGSMKRRDGEDEESE